MDTHNSEKGKRGNWIMRQTSFAKTFAIMSVIVFVTAFCVYLVVDSMSATHGVDILYIIRQTFIVSAVLLFILYHPLKYMYIRANGKNMSDDEGKANGTGDIAGRTSFAKTALVAGVILFVIFLVSLLLKNDDTTTISELVNLRTIGIVAVAVIALLFLFWYFPTKAMYNLSQGQSKADYLKSKERIIGLFIAGTFLVFLLSALVLFGLFGFEVWGNVTALTDATADQILYGKIPYGVIVFVAGEFLLFLYLKISSNRSKN